MPERCERAADAGDGDFAVELGGFFLAKSQGEIVGRRS